MNFRKLITYLTMGTAAAMPLAVAQNPTILQGSYISNVFGNSNFIKNPNAQTNIADVTVSNATVTRSTTTPLVATSEFLVTTSTSTGSATWSTRTFDAGMKGQNCEARFTYRGFSVGSTTAQILQGANVVAQLTLTASTDPRIASINFPCGDLSSATTFRLQQATASLTGTNEIGGIYVGLATNMANVAQAENVVRATRTTAQSMTTSAWTTVEYATEQLDVYGEYETGRFTAKRAGNYNFSASILFNTTSWTAGKIIDIAVWKNGSQVSTNEFTIAATQSAFFGNSINYTTDLNVGEYIEIRVNHNNGSNLNLLNSGTYNWLQIDRFPSSSELVVTPERQNVFAGIKGSGGGSTNSVTSAAWAKLTTIGAFPRTTFGKAKVETNNDLSVTVENLPVGSYFISATAAFHAQASGAGDNTVCFFGLADSATGGAQIGGMQVSSSGDASAPTQGVLGQTMTGIYQNTSVANRTFFIQAYRIAGTGSCYVFVGSERPVTISVIPLDQPSNSALYVQGPILGAQTGAAIGAGYVGETYVNNSTVDYFAGLNTYASLTLNPGVWMLFAKASVIDSSGSAAAYIDGSCIISTNSAADPTNYPTAWINQGDYFVFGGIGASNGFTRSGNGSNLTVFNLTSQQTVYLRCRLSQSAGVYAGRGSIRAVRLN